MRGSVCAVNLRETFSCVTRPRVGGQPLRVEGETAVEAAIRFALSVDGGVLPIQGPPGSGKTHTGARLIAAIANVGLRVGMTANSHKVIRNLLGHVCRAADEIGVDITRMIGNVGVQAQLTEPAIGKVEVDLLAQRRSERMPKQ